MELFAIVLGITPFLAGRPMLAMFVLACAWVGGNPVLRDGQHPTFLQVSAVIAVFVVLAALEEVWKRVVEWTISLADVTRSWVRTLDVALSGAAAVLIGAFIVSSSHDGSLLSINGALVVVAGALAVATSRMRASVLEAIDDANVADLPISGHLSLLEIVWTIAGVALTLWSPYAGAVVAAASVLASFGLLLTARAVRHGSRTLCAGCGHDMHASALVCGDCGAGHASAKAIGFFGARKRAAQTSERHRFALLSVRRCPDCAEPLTGGAVSACCTRCRREAFPDSAALRAFVRYVDRRVLMLLPFAALVGLVPVLGWPIAMLMFRVSRASCMSSFAAWHGRTRTRLVHRALMALAAILQFIPFVGALVVVASISAIHLSNRASVLRGVPAPAKEGAMETAQASAALVSAR